MNISVLETTTTTTTTTERTTIVFTSTSISTTTTRTATAHRRLLFTHKPWVYYSFGNSQSSTTTIHPTIKSITPSSALSLIGKTTLPMPTPWYSPAGPYDWWQWQWHTTKFQKSPMSIHSTTQPPTTSTQTTSTTRQTSTTTTTTASTTHSSTKTSTITTTTKYIATVDLFKRPSKQPDSTKEKPFTDFDEEYHDWLDYFSTNDIQPIITSTVTTSTLISISPRQQYSQMGFLPTKPNSKIVTINTLSSKRQQSQQNPSVSERNAIGTQTNGMYNLIKQFY